jgi:phosphoribosylformylglycinamidine synthase
MNAAVLVFPGINRERDMARTLRLVSGRAPAMVWHTETALPKVDVVVVPGGFTYGDYLRVGAMAARAPIMAAVADAAKKGIAVLGICNGFQILCEAGLLPGALMRNASLRFAARDVHLKVERTDTPFTRAYLPGAVIGVPIAHHDGSYFADDETLARLEGNGRVVFRYVDAGGNRTEAANPNGSLNGIAGICSAARNVVGLMPHPERAVDPLTGSTDGAPMFAGLVGEMA